MKRRKLKISIIPHGSENVRVTRFFIIILPIVALMILIGSIMISAITIINIRNIKDFRSIKKLREDVAILTIKNRESQKTISEIEKGIDNLKKKTQNLLPYYSYMSGISRTDSHSVYLPEQIDSLLQFTDFLIYSYDSIYSIVKNKSYADKIPSIIPVNGWVLRDYGNIIDPYTETERFHPGILIVANAGENVYSAADGYVLFAGEKEKLGKTVIIKHSQEYTTTYAHLSGIEVNSGKTVKKGDLIGYIGKSGKVISSALYYEILLNDKSINPKNSFLVPVYDLYDSLNLSL